MAEKGFIFGMFNPIHYGHINLIRIGLNESDKIGLYIGRKEKPDVLPYEIRRKSIESVLEQENISNKVSIIKNSEKSLFDFYKKRYTSLIIGSDVLNLLIPESKLTEKERKMIASFKKIVFVNRGKNILGKIPAQILSKKSKLIEYHSTCSFSSSEIRKKVVNGEKIDELIPSYVMDIISPYTNFFNP